MLRFVSALILTAVMVSQTSAQNIQTTEPESKTPESKTPISKIQFETEQRALFSKADKDYNGVVSFDELNAVKQARNLKRFEARFHALDTDQNGFLSDDEINLAHEDIKAGRLTRIEQSKTRLLNTYDLDENGTITSREIEEYFEKKQQDEEDKSITRAQDDFAKKDKDGDGRVSLEEYTDQWSKLSRGRLGDNTRSISRDGNGDRMISRTENESFIDKVFNHLDANDDGEISPTEQSGSYARIQAFDTTRVFIKSSRR